MSNEEEEDAVQEMKNFVIGSGGKIDEEVRLSDGHGFMTASFPLPKTHWIYELDNTGFSLPPPMPFRMLESNPKRKEFIEKIRAAGKYAVRSATMNGKTEDFDPDALVQNLIVGMVGYYTEDGLSEDRWANPDPIPDVFNG